jgi:hypothetical protein
LSLEFGVGGSGLVVFGGKLNVLELSGSNVSFSERLHHFVHLHLFTISVDDGLNFGSLSGKDLLVDYNGFLNSLEDGSSE